MGVDVFNMMKGIVDDIPRGRHAGQTTEATPVFNYVDDNTTVGYSLGLQHQHPNYVTYLQKLNPAVGIYNNKINGEYPPFD